MSDKPIIYFREFPENATPEAMEKMLHDWANASFIFDRHNYELLSVADKAEHLLALQKLVEEETEALKSHLAKA